MFQNADTDEACNPQQPSATVSGSQMLIVRIYDWRFDRLMLELPCARQRDEFARHSRRAQDQRFVLKMGCYIHSVTMMEQRHTRNTGLLRNSCIRHGKQSVGLKNPTSGVNEVYMLVYAIEAMSGPWNQNVDNY